MLLGRFLVKSWALPEVVVQTCSIKKRVHNNFPGKRLCRSLFFDKTADWKPATLLKRDFSTDLFLCIFWNSWCESLDILLLFLDIFWCCCYCWCCHIKFLLKWVDEKLFSRCRLPFFRMFVYVLLKFDWLRIFFSRIS